MASAPAVVEREQAPNRLVVDESSNDDDSVVALNPKRLQELDHYRGDTVLIKGTRDTICVVLADDSCEAGKIRMNAVVRKNLGVRLGDCVSLHECSDIMNGKKIFVLPVSDTSTTDKFSGNLLATFLKPYFDTYRPVHKGDTFTARVGTGSATRVIEFKVLETDPAEYCIVAPNTEIICQGEPLSREAEEAQDEGGAVVAADDTAMAVASTRAAAASLATMSIVAAGGALPSGTPPRSGRLVVAAPNELATPEHAAAPASAEVLSPDTLTVRTLKDAKTIDRVTASYLPAGNRGPRHKGMITCDFKRRVITFTPDDKAIVRFTIQLSDVKKYSLFPDALELELSLKSSGPGIQSASPGGVLPAGVNRRECGFLFTTLKKYEEVVAEMQRVLVFRAGSFDADFVLVNACGEGSNGECYVVHRRAAASAPQLCVKVPRNGSTSDMQEEVDLMRKLGDCEYIVQFVAYYREGEGANLRQHIVMELMVGGDLYKHVDKRMQERGNSMAAMEDEEVRQVTWRMLQGLRHMHGKKMMHRDIKLDNVLLAARGDDGFGDPATAKLSDFGTSKQLGADLSRATTLRLGTVAYCAPEISEALLPEEGPSGRPRGLQAGYTNAADVWSVGVTLYVMLAQVYPCGSACWSDDLLAQGVREKVVLGLEPGSPAYEQLHARGSPIALLFGSRDADARDLLAALMRIDPAARLTAAQALAHPWFSGM